MSDPPSPPPGFLGTRSHVIASAVDGAHTVTLAWYAFPGSVALVPYVELSESHDGARPGRVMALSTLVHLCQNVGEDEVWAIGGRERAGVEDGDAVATLRAMLTASDAALREALDEFEDALPYVPEYFAEKYGYAATLERLRAVATGAGDRATLPATMPLPTLTQFAAAAHAASTDSASAWNALSPSARTAIEARMRWTLDYLAGGEGRAAGTIYEASAASPGDPPPVQPAP